MPDSIDKLLRAARRASARAGLAGALLLVSGCGSQSPLNPGSPQAHEIADLWWWMLAGAMFVFLGAVGMLGMAWRRRGRKGLPIVGEDEHTSNVLVVMFGITIPILALIALFIVANLSVVKATSAPDPRSTPVTIDIVGHQWFWAVRYPGSSAVTANEIHIPARTRVNVVATTDDVIHSLWVPALNRKIDLIPGRRNRILLYADKPGVYRGQCAEFCGLQHAHMSLKVIADPPDEYRSWVANMARAAPAPQTPSQRRGQHVFLANPCASCHTIRGTDATGTVGPDLTHLETRTTLAGLTIPNTPESLANWILNPQHVKPGNKMPGLDLGKPDLRALVDYLTSLR